MEKRFLIYMRQSKKDNSEYTFDVQKIGIEQFARLHNIKLDFSEDCVFHEEVSAYRDSVRPLFEEAVSLLFHDSRKTESERKYAGIIFFNVSRLSRNSNDFTRIEKLMELGYKMLSATENIIDSPAGMYFFRMIQVESIHYSDRQSSKSLNYRLHTLTQNPYKYLWGRGVTYGFQNIDGVVTIHPIESKIVRKIFELRAKSVPLAMIESLIREEFSKEVREFNKKTKRKNEYRDSYYEVNDSEDDSGDTEKEEPARYESTPNVSKISSILNNEGEFRYNGTRVSSLEIKFSEDVRMLNELYFTQKQGFRILTGEGKFLKWDNQIEFDTPKLEFIEKELYNAIFKQRQATLSRKFMRNNKDYVKIYQDIVSCTCGARMVAKKEGGHRYYRCSNAIRGDSCENDTRLNEEFITLFIQNEIFPFIRLEPEDKEYEAIVEAMKFRQIERLNSQIKTETGHITRFNRTVDETWDVDIREAYIKKIREKESDIELLRNKVEEIELISKDMIKKFFACQDSFLSLDTYAKGVYASLIIESMVIWEDRNEDSIYQNPQNRKSIVYQKKITELKLVPYLHELFILNKYHNGIT